MDEQLKQNFNGITDNFGLTLEEGNHIVINNSNITDLFSFSGGNDGDNIIVTFSLGSYN